MQKRRNMPPKKSRLMQKTPKLKPKPQRERNNRSFAGGGFAHRRRMTCQGTLMSSRTVKSLLIRVVVMLCLGRSTPELSSPLEFSRDAKTADPSYVFPGTLTSKPPSSKFDFYQRRILFTQVE